MNHPLLKANEPLSEGQLKAFGFCVFYKKKKGETVFDQCSLDCATSSYLQGELVGNFYSPPSFLQIVDQIAENATRKEYYRIKEKIANNLIDGLNI